MDCLSLSVMPLILPWRIYLVGVSDTTLLQCDLSCVSPHLSLEYTYHHLETFIKIAMTFWR